MGYIMNDGLGDVASTGGGNFGWATSQGSGSPEKQALVDRIKNFQRQGPQNKEAWYSCCGEMKDPSRHTVQFLKEFCSAHVVGDEGARGGKGSKGNDSPEKQALVDRIKNFQRQGPQNKETW